MKTIRSTLWELRRLRTSQAAHNDKAIEYLHRATRGTSAKHATNIGGTGRCPLTNNADRYTREHEAGIKAKQAAETLWKQIEPQLAAIELDPRSVITLYYNVAMAWEDIPAAIKRSPQACVHMHWETIIRLEREPS